MAKGQQSKSKTTDIHLDARKSHHCECTEMEQQSQKPSSTVTSRSTCSEYSSLFPLLHFKNLKSDVKVLFCCESCGSVLRISDWTLKRRRWELSRSLATWLFRYKRVSQQKEQETLLWVGSIYILYALPYLSEGKVPSTPGCHQPSFLKSWDSSPTVTFRFSIIFCTSHPCSLWEDVKATQQRIWVRKHGRVL